MSTIAADVDAVGAVADTVGAVPDGAPENAMCVVANALGSMADALGAVDNALGAVAGGPISEGGDNDEIAMDAGDSNKSIGMSSIPSLCIHHCCC